jgi:DNA-binding SARP family transcriptional activator
MLHLSLLGDFRAEVDSRPLPVTQFSDLIRLWSYLVLHPWRPISREQLAFILWPDLNESKARARLRACLHHLREILPPAPAGQPWLLEENRSLRWNLNSDTWLDVTEFSQAAGSSDCGTLTTGLALYQADLLPELAAPWLSAERARLRELYQQALHRLVGLQTDGGDYVAAQATAERLFRSDSRSEVALRLLMQVCYRCGDRARALHQFDDYRASLSREGLADHLSPETLALREAIAQGVDISPPADLPPAAEVVGKPRESLPSRSRAFDLSTGHRLLRRWRWILLATVVLFTLGLAYAILSTYRLFSPRKTLTITGPQAVQSTWILSDHPDATSMMETDEWWSYVDLHDGRGPIHLHLPFSQYPAARLNLTGNAVVDALLYFDLGELPGHSRVESAQLTVYLDPDTLWANKEHFPPVVVAVYRLLRAWDPATTTFNTPWAEPGLRPGEDYDSKPLSQLSFSSPGYLTFDLKSAFPSWQRGRNFGVVLMVLEAPSGYVPYWLITARHPDPSLWPRLVIQYR